jgi:phospho-N-acetylmuramoyl-pentapeptide-transferase
MLYYLHLLTDVFSPLRVFQYITVRTFAAAATAFVLSMVFGPALIRLLRRLKIGQQIRVEHVETLHVTHGAKAGTPTMGGVMIIFSAGLATLLWAMPTNGFVWLALSTFVVMGAVGFHDDYLKIRHRHSRGLAAKQKLLWQAGWALLVVVVLTQWEPTATVSRQLMLPFFKQPVIEQMPLWVMAVFTLLVLVGCTNAVNLTDGLDGLAIGCSNAVVAAYLAMAYVAGHVLMADYLQVPYIEGSGELAVFCGALLGAGLGFLWFNCYPAKVFMGDTGSLALGGAIAIVAILINQELTLLFVGGVFVVETLSVILQVGSFKLRGGKRIFRMAPIHHHFELIERDKAEQAGRPLAAVEMTVTVRFWIVAIVCALIGLATLKIR